MEEWVRYGIALLVGLVAGWPVRALFKPLLDRIGARIAMPAWSKEEMAYLVEYERLNFDAVAIENKMRDIKGSRKDYAANYQCYVDRFGAFVHMSIPSSMHLIHKAIQEAYSYMKIANSCIQEMVGNDSIFGLEKWTHALSSSDQWIEHSHQLMAEFSARRKPLPITVVETREEFESSISEP